MVNPGRVGERPSILKGAGRIFLYIRWAGLKLTLVSASRLGSGVFNDLVAIIL